MRVIGTCSLCGGAVVIEPALSVKPVPPKCSNCGAVPVSAHGPTIEMKRPQVSHLDFRR